MKECTSADCLGIYYCKELTYLPDQETKIENGTQPLVFVIDEMNICFDAHDTRVGESRFI